MINCYHFIINKNGIFQRQGIPCEGFFDGNKVMLNGLGMYRIYQKPVTIENPSINREDFNKKFSEYTESTPWIGIENESEIFLYRAYIEPDHLYFHAFCPEKPNIEYVLIEAPIQYRLQILSGGRVIFRRFSKEEDKVFGLMEIDGGAILKADNGYDLIMIEATENGQFTAI